MAYRPPPEWGNSFSLCRGDREWSSRSSGVWGKRHHLLQHHLSFDLNRKPSHRSFAFTRGNGASCACFSNKNGSVCEKVACSARQCSLPIASGVYDGIPVALFSARAFLLPFEASSLKISTRLQIGLITFRRPGRWVCFGGGPRPKRPRLWKTRQRRGTVSKSQKLVDHVRSLSNVKEEVYGALDAFIAWEVEFPLIAVKKALQTLKYERDWKRIIQVSKWMLGKGQGKTLGTYLLLLEAFDRERRIEEAQELWERVVTTSLGHTPRIFFSQMISMFDRHGMYDELLEVFADMEELDVKPSPGIVNKVALVYEKLEILDKAEKVKEKYPAPTTKYRTANGKVIKFRVNSTTQDERRGPLEEINAVNNFPATDSYDSSVDEDFDSAEEENVGDSLSVKDAVVGTSTRQVGEEVHFV